jgi:YebC/PmpR family DNA-binding regulatory protein
MFTKAREASVPMETIERAIKRGTGELEGVRYEAISYEGYAPAGVAVMAECLTDNRNRTGAEVRSLFTRNGGSIAEPGAVSWQFERKGILVLSKERGEDEVMEVALDAGAEDLSDGDDHWEVTCAPADLSRVRESLEAAGVEVRSAELTFVPTTTVLVDNESHARTVLRLVNALDDHDDVQNVYANFDIPDAILSRLDAQDAASP